MASRFLFPYRRPHAAARSRAARHARPARQAAAAAALAAIALVAGLMPASAAPAPARPWSPPPQKFVSVHAVPARKVKIPPIRPWHRPPTTWPAAGSATVTLTGPAGGSRQPQRAVRAGSAALAVPGPGAARAGKLPVWVSQPVALAGPGASRATTASAVTVTAASEQAARAAGIKGAVFAVSRADGNPAAGQVHVTVNYSGFAYAWGGDYAARLRLVELPGCALTTPRLSACRRQTPLPGGNDVRAGDLGADIIVPATATPAATPVLQRSQALISAAPAAVVLAATAGPSGSAGDYTATSLSEAGQWSAGNSNGSFDYSYPIQVPPVPGGLEPDVSLGYDSQSVDGLTSSTNDEASWIGDGWDYSPGYVERSFQSCETKPPGATNNWAASGDFCWSSNDAVTLSLNGQDTTLVQNSPTSWHPEVDNGERVQYETGASNGTNDGGYWVITTTDGTSYYFGLNELPGYTSSDTTTNSAWTMPVFATSAGQCGYNATYASSYCPNVAWRWNLDYVTDTHGDAITYDYSTETNYYARDNATTADSSYIQGGALTSIQYGLRAGAVYGTTPAAQITFTVNQNRTTDVPTDLACSNGAACLVVSPTFWGKYELATITTSTLKGTTLSETDQWALAYSYPATGDTTTPPSLWLNSITRTGEDGTPVPLKPVSFTPTLTGLANRIESPAELNDGYSIISRMRMYKITNETGAVTTINYLAPSGGCTSGSLPAPDANTLQCYPDYWTPPNATTPILDWFNKYVVNEVTTQDTYGGSPDVVTQYSYLGAAWHYNDDALTRSQQRTWDSWRGYRTVTTETGPASAPDTKTTDTYFQGMNGDYQANGTTTSVSLTSGHGDTVADLPQYEGMQFEHVVDNGPSGAMVTDTVTLPWTSAATAVQSQPTPLPSLQAFMTGTAENKTYTALASGATRESDTTYTHDSYGRVTSVSDVPDTTDASQDTCTTTSYATNTSAWLLDLPAEVQAVSVPCGTAVTLPGDAVSDTLTFYDGATSLSSDTPTAGDATETQLATSYTGTPPAPVYTTESTATYDEYGRPLTTGDADSLPPYNRPLTITAYTPATGAEPISVSVTDPQGLVTTTTYDPARDLPLTVTSPASLTTTEQYDALGRLTSVWTPGQATSGTPNYAFTYNVTNTGPSVITSKKLEPSGTSQLPTETLYDSLGRVRETQAETAAGNTDVSDIDYNSDGWQILTSDPYPVSGTPTTNILEANQSNPLADNVPSQTGYVYDGTGRVTRQIAYALGSETSEIDTGYGGNYTTTSYKNLVPGQPDGGTPETVFTDGRGLTSAIYQYHTGVTPDPSGPASGYDATSYTWTPVGKLAAITDASDNLWKYGYNLAGNQTSQTTPDTGLTQMTYDPAGQLMTVTDARNSQISYTYDNDGRKTAEYDTTSGALESSATKLASWTWDTLPNGTSAKGMLTSSSSYYNGFAYTEQVTGYNPFGLPMGYQTVIPSDTSVAGGKLAGTYSQIPTYNAATGQVKSLEDSAAGGLPQETYGWGLDNAGNPTSLGSYVSNLTYYPLGYQPYTYTLGTSKLAYMTDTWDPQTGRLKEQVTQAGTGLPTVDDQNYSYDNTGQILSEADTPAGSNPQVQCFQYDYLGRLSQAWSQGSAGCAATPSQPAEGGAAPYWESFTYDAQNNLKTETSTPPSGTATTITDTYPGAGSAQPHTISSQSIAAPSGTTATSYKYDPAGNLTGITGASAAQTLTWDDAGRLASDVTTGGSNPGTTSYLYDADGNLLIRADPGTATLYLSDEEITASTIGATTTLSGVRYYSIGGQVIAARTSATPTTPAAVSYLIDDATGTSTMSIDASSYQVSERYYDPYGNQIGTQPTTWPGDQSFADGTTDPATSLENLGAREYNPGTASFISPDSLLTPFNPQDLNPYAYAQDTPPTGEDPTGMSTAGAPPNPCGANPNCNPHNPATGNGSSPTKSKGKRPAGGGSSIIQVSQHVYVSARDPQAHILQQAWKVVIRRYGSPRSSYEEYNDWWHLCGLYPSLCKGQFGLNFNVIEEPGRITGTIGAFNAGISLIVTSVKGGTVLPAIIVAANYAQKWYRETFSAKGRFSNQTIDDVADALRGGTLTPEDVPIDIIIRSGNGLILNTRSAQALTRAGVPRENWSVIDRTGINKYERMLNRQLNNNDLTEAGFEDPWSFDEFGSSSADAGAAGE